MPLELILNEGKSLSTLPSGKERAMPYMDNIRGDQMNPGIRVFPLPSAKSLLGGQMSR